MADKGWTSRAAVAAAAAAGTGAAQLGLGYGLSVVVWPVAATPDDSAWLGSLGWATWIAASATVFGAVIAGRLGVPAVRGPWRALLAASAGLGSLVTVALIALPARDAVRADTFSPQLIAGGYALVGVVLGVLLAYWAVSSRPVAANLIATAVWLWSLAIAAVVVELTAHRASATYLTSWQFVEPVDGVRYGTISWPSGLLTLGAAFLLGLVAAAPAARRGDLGVGAATCGVAGPLLVATAFLALAPQVTGTAGPLASAYLIAPYAVLAGLAGSALAVTVARTAAERRASTGSAATDQGADPGTREAGPKATARATDQSADPDTRKPGPTPTARTTDQSADPGAPQQTRKPDPPATARATDQGATPGMPRQTRELDPTTAARHGRDDPATGRLGQSAPTAGRDAGSDPATGRRASPDQQSRSGNGPPEPVPAGDPATFPAAPAPKTKPATGRAKPPTTTTKTTESTIPVPARERQATGPALGTPRPAKTDTQRQRPASTVTPPPSDPTVARINRPPAK